MKCTGNRIQKTVYSVITSDAFMHQYTLHCSNIQGIHNTHLMYVIQCILYSELYLVISRRLTVYTKQYKVNSLHKKVKKKLSV